MRPVLFQLGSFEVDAYGFFALLGFAAMLLYMQRQGQRLGFSPRQVRDGGLAAVVGCVLGGRLVYLAVNHDYLAANPWVALQIWQGGLVSYGGLAGALGSVALYARRRALGALKALDFACLAPHLAIGIGRLGCFCAGCDYGTPAHGFPLAVIYRDPRSLVPPELLGVPLHPTQLYLALTHCALFVLGYRWLGQPHPAGRVFGKVAIGYAVARFSLEFLRGDLERGFVVPGYLSGAQLFCLVWLGVGLWTLNRTRC